MSDLDHLRAERLRTWEQAKALIDTAQAEGRTLTEIEQVLWDDLYGRLERLDKVLASNTGNTNTTHWSGASGPPVSAGGGGDSSYYGMNGVRPSERDAYMRGVHEGQEIIKAIREGRRTVEAATEAADTATAIVTHLKAAQPKPLDALSAERTCSVCHIGEFSPIGAGPFSKDGVCRYCAELNAIEHVAAQGSHPHQHAPDYPAHQHKRIALPPDRGGQPKLWPQPVRVAVAILMISIASAAGAGIIVGLVSLARLATGH